MTTEATLTFQGDPYEGLHDMSRLCLDRLRVRIETVRPWHTLKPIMGGGPGVWDDIRDFFRGILNALNWDNLTWNIRWNVIEPLGSWLREHIFDPLKSVIGAIKDRFLSWFNWDNLTWNIRWNVIQPLGAWLKEHIFDPLKSVIGAIKDRFLSWFNWDNLTWNIRWNVIQPLGAWLKEHIFDPIKGAIEALSTFLHDPIEGFRKLWESFQSTWAGQLLNVFTDPEKGLVAFIIHSLQGGWQNWPLYFTLAANAAIEGIYNWIERRFEGIYEIPATYLNWVAMSAGTDLALQPSRAIGTIGSLYEMSIKIGAKAHIIATILSAMPLIDATGASQYAAYIAEFAGFEQITRASYGVLLNEVLAMPLRYHWNQLLRPKLPTEGEIFIMGRKHGITEGEFRQAMAYMGIPDWWITKMYDFFWTDPSPMWLLRMTEGGIPRLIDPMGKREWLDQWLPGWSNDPYAWLKMKLMLAGYEDVDIEPMISGMKTRALASPLTQFKTSVRAMIREAYWTKDDAAATLSPWNVRTEEIELMYRAEELDYQKRYLDGEADYYAEQFRKGLIDDQDLGLALSTIIVKPERVAQIVARERVRALAKPKAITAPKEDPLVTSLRKQATDSWIKLYRDWKIEEADLLQGLIIVLQDKDLVEKMVAVEKTRYRPPLPPPVPPKEDPIMAQGRRQAIASWVDGARKGEITFAELELYLEPLIPDKNTRTQVVNLEMLRYKPTPDLIPVVSEDPNLAKIRQQQVAGHCEMFQKRLIGLEQLYHYLLADGLVEPLSRSTVITQATKRIKMPGLDSPYFLSDTLQALVEQGLEAYDEMYMEGIITIDQYIAWLTTMAADPEVITYLADTLTLRRFLERL